MADFPNESVQAQSFQDATDLSAIFAGEHALEQPVAQPAEVIFSAHYGQQNRQVAGGEEVEPAMAAVMHSRFTNPPERSSNGDLYNAAQIALRAVASGVTIEALLGP